MDASNPEISDVDFWHRVEPLLIGGLAEVNGAAPSGAVAQVLQLLLQRIVTTVHVLITLGRNYSSAYYQHDACSLLRCCYDAYIQAAFITIDKTTAEEKAQDYLDFDHVERHLAMEKVLKSNLPFKSQIENSPLRTQNESALLRELNRVAPRFKTKSNEFRKNWYKGDLRAVASKCGLAEEYDFLLSRLHPSVHSSAYALRRGAGVPHQHVTFYGIRLVFRLLGLLAAHHGVTFSDSEVRELVDSFAVDLFAPPT